jgi:hypothetical protein
MRSYEAARRYFGILEFFAWCLVLIGGFVVIAAIVAMAEANQQFGGPPTFMIFVATGLPGAGVAFAGLLGLVFAQTGRAGVDSAEYGQQSLKIARDQLELSKQALRQGARDEPGYAALQTAKQDLQSDAPSSNASYAPPVPESIETDILAPPHDEAIDYKGKLISSENGHFLVGHIRFDSLEEAQQFIDYQTNNPKPNQTGTIRS